MSQEARSPVRNRILAALPPEDYERIAPHLEPIHLPLNQSIHTAHEVMSHVYFPEYAMISIVSRMADGRTVEVGVVGREGMAGIDTVLGEDKAHNDSMVQISNGGTRMRTEALREEFSRGGALQGLLLGFLHSFVVQVSQTAACNRLHTVEERLARWLLMSHDRANSDELPLTQEFIAMMLGVRRAGVTVAAISLQAEELIQYTRGNIRILDRQGLEELSCECYETVKAASSPLPGDRAGEARETLLHGVQ